MNAGLPEYTRNRGGYYSWRHPDTGQEFGLGRDRAEAIKAARKANAHLASLRPTLLDRIIGGVKTWGEWCDDFERILAGRDSRPNTQRTRKALVKHLRTVASASKSAALVDTADCAAALDKLYESGKRRTAQALRSLMVDCFRRMIAKGVRKDNPADVTDSVVVKVTRARLEFDVFLHVYGSCQLPELKNAIALALVSGQPRECLAAAQFKDQRDGFWWCERGKTGARIRIPHTLRLECFGKSLADVITDCRRTGILSPYLIHRTRRAKGARVGAGVHVDILTRLFTAELAKLGINWGDKDSPTLHEIRSLSERLYRAQGDVDPQTLLGHKSPKMTATYDDPRGGWVDVMVRK